MIKLLLYVYGPWLLMDFYKFIDNTIINLSFIQNICVVVPTHRLCHSGLSKFFKSVFG